MIGGGCAYVFVDMFIMPQSQEFALWKVDGGEAGNIVATKTATAHGERRIGGEKKAAADGLSRKHRWIAAASAAAKSGDAETMTDLAFVYARGEERQRVDLRATVALYEEASKACRRTLTNLLEFQSEPSEILGQSVGAVRGGLRLERDGVELARGVGGRV